jgi:hypothetical protein
MGASSNKAGLTKDEKGKLAYSAEDSGGDLPRSNKLVLCEAETGNVVQCESHRVCQGVMIILVGGDLSVAMLVDCW